MKNIATWFAIALSASAPPAQTEAPPTAQELGYPAGCKAIYGGTGGAHLIKVSCPGPDLSNLPSAEPALHAEARAELSRMFAEAPADTLKLRNVRQVKGSICGEVSFEATGRPPVFRLFTYRPGKDAAIDLPPQPPLTADGAQCPVRDDILAICAPTATEREQAELRIARCRLSPQL